MYLRVMVLEIKDDYCLALTDEGAVVRIRKKEGLQTGDRIYVLTEDLYHKEKEEAKKIPFPVFKIAAAAAAFLLIFTALLFSGRKDGVYAAVSLDGEKSVQLGLNHDYQITDAVSYDGSMTDAQLHNLKGRSLSDAKQQLQIQSSENHERVLVGYGVLKDEDGMADSEFESYVKKEFEDCPAVYLKGDKKDIEEAKKEKKTLGLYIVKKAAEEDKLEEYLEDMSLEELLKQLRNHPALMEEEELRDILEEKWEKAIEEKEKQSEAEEDRKDAEDDLKDAARELEEKKQEEDREAEEEKRDAAQELEEERQDAAREAEEERQDAAREAEEEKQDAAREAEEKRQDAAREAEEKKREAAEEEEERKREEAEKKAEREAEIRENMEDSISDSLDNEQDTQEPLDAGEEEDSD